MSLTFHTDTGCACRRRVPGRYIVQRYRESCIPKNATSAQVKASSRKLALDLVRLKRQLLIEGQRGLSRMLRDYFRKVLNEICDRVESGHYSLAAAVTHTKTGGSSVAPYGLCPVCGSPGISRERRTDGNDRCANGHTYPSATSIPVSTKAETTFHLGGHEAAWRAAIEEVLGPGATVRLLGDYLPGVQSVAAKAYSRTCLLLGDEESADASVKILRRAQDLARQVTRINETTRTRLALTIQREVDAGTPAAEIVRKVRNEIPEIEARRIPTIVRTEVGNAIDAGTKEAMKESSSITHVRVIGCTGIEPGSPTIDGIPTCNVAGVPVARIDELRFHPNHTGTIVAQYFIGDNYSGPIYSGGV